jgi:hypothetical protein
MDGSIPLGATSGLCCWIAREEKGGGGRECIIVIWWALLPSLVPTSRGIIM